MRYIGFRFHPLSPRTPEATNPFCVPSFLGGEYYGTKGYFRASLPPAAWLGMISGMGIVVASVLVAVALVVAALILRPALRMLLQARSARESTLALLQGQMLANAQQTAQLVEALRHSLTESMDNLSTQLSRALGDTNRTVGERLDQTSRVIGDVRQQLGQVDESSRRLLELGKDIARLEDILQPPKLRGALGEFLLGELLAQVLPAAHFRMQHSFRGGQIVDAAIFLRDGIVPVDAKFPLDNFRRILASESEEQRKAARRIFMKDVKGHIDAISGKYIRTDEGTFDFALMYIPAENVYYETIIRDEDQQGDLPLLNYSLKKRVIPVSPNTFYAYLQTVVLGLKGLQVEERSREILAALNRLEKDFSLFGESFRLVGQHLDNSLRKYGESQKRFDRLEGKVRQFGESGGLETPAPSTGAAPSGA